MDIEREWFTIEDLATFWKVSISDIEHLLETKKLRADFQDHGDIDVFPYPNGVGHYYMAKLERLVPFDFKKSKHGLNKMYLLGKIIILNSEVEKYEREHCETTQPISMLSEKELEEDPPYTDEQKQETLCKALKDKGLPEKDIAKRLKNIFPKIYPSRIGRLLPANPGTHIQNGSHRKRGVRLLE